MSTQTPDEGHEGNDEKTPAERLRVVDVPAGPPRGVATMSIVRWVLVLVTALVATGSILSYAGVHLSGGARFHEIGNRDRRQQPDDGYHDHDFHEREAQLKVLLDLHTLFLFLFVQTRGVNNAEGGLLIIRTVAH